MSDPPATDPALLPIVLDATAPLVPRPRAIRKHAATLRRGGVDAVLGTVASVDDLRPVTLTLAAWQAYANDPQAEAVVATSVADLRRAKTQGRLAVALHMQGLDAIGSDVDLVDLYQALDLRVAQPTRNYRNMLGDGCCEPSDAGLSEAAASGGCRQTEEGS